MELILLTSAMQPTAEVLPALGLLPHQVTVLPLDAARAGRPADRATRCCVDARRDSMGARAFLRVLAADRHRGAGDRRAHRGRPDRDVRPSGRSTTSCSTPPGRPSSTPGCGWRSSGARRPPRTPSGRRRDRRPRPSTRPPTPPGCPAAPLDLTYKEFELLKFLAQHPGRVFTRSHLRAGGLGLRLLRRHPHGRRARPAAAGQARRRARADDRHRAQRRLQVRPAGREQPAAATTEAAARRDQAADRRVAGVPPANV